MNFKVKPFVSRLLCLPCALALSCSTLLAQVVVDSTTATLDDVTNSITGNVTIGTNFSFTALILTNGALLTNSGSGTIGQNIGAKSNYVWLTSPNTRWFMGNALTMGLSGAGNQLVVSNGAVVRNTVGNLGFSSSSSSNNRVVVTGAGSLWTNVNNISVGFSGAGNQLVVSNGGTVFANTGGTLGFNASSSNNLAVVTGAGSVWANFGELRVGNMGLGNQLVVSNGAVVINSSGSLGFSQSSSNNLATVTGIGSLWSNYSGLYVGNAGSGNRLVVSDGAVVRNLDGYLGYNANGSSNVAVVTGAGSVWNSANSLYTGYLGYGNQLIVSNGGVVTSFAGTIGISSSNQVLVTGAGSVWTNLNDLRVGGGGPGNRLIVTNGGVVRTGAGTIGSVNGSGSEVVVTDAGSMWTGTGNLTVGSLSFGNRLVVSNGGVVVNVTGFLGTDQSNNVAVITGAGSVWANTSELTVGYVSSSNQLLVTNGGMVQNTIGYLGRFSNSNNVAVVTGAGSVWTNAFILYVGYEGSGNQLVVSNGGVVRSSSGFVGFSGSNSVAVVTGEGSVWSSVNSLTVGNNGSENQLVVTNGGAVFASTPVTLGLNSSSTNNRIITDGGTLRVTNAVATGVFDLRRGTNILNAGMNDVDRLVMTSIAGFFEFNGGTLNVRTSTVNNGVAFTVGNGTSAATYRMSGNPTNRHTFANGLLIANNALLTGNGTAVGGVTVQSGGTLSPGTSVGMLVLSNSPSLQGATLMEISKNGTVRTNDQIQVAGALTYGGSLTVSNLGPTALVVGDRFQLFSAPTYGGSFIPLNLPPLGAGLGWTNKLLLDGSIEVAAVSPPKFSNATVVGTNLVISGTGGAPAADYTMMTATNVAQPLINWVSLVTNQFDLSGNFSFTNGITPGELQRYFRIRIP